MENSTVKILFHNENADSIVASAGRISTTKGSAIEIYEKSCEKEMSENAGLIRKIISSGHTSVLEHIFLNLAFNDVSVFVEQFMIEFRLASFTVKSRRYVDYGNMGYVLPNFGGHGANAEEMEKIYREHMEFLFAEYNAFLAQGIPKEDARFVLPYSFCSYFYCTVNARELIKIVNEMVWGRGSEYPEIAALGKSLLEQCEEKLPFLHFGHAAGGSEVPSLKSRFGESAHTPGNDEELVVLLDSTEKPEEIICRAALLEAGAAGWRTADVANPQLQKETIKAILQKPRRRELEQAHFTILFQHISLAGVTHLVRHRMQSIVVPKYTEVCDFGKFILPDSIVEAGLRERYENVFAETQKVMNRLKEAGMESRDSVYLMLSGQTIPILTTMNANELFTFIRLRTCSRAQWEIADNAKALLKILRGKYPTLFSLYGPTCYVAGACPEGRMTCGKMEEVRAFFETDSLG